MEGVHLIDLPGPDLWENIPGADLTLAMGNRKSHRVYLNQHLSLEELAIYLASVGKVRP